MWKRSLHLDFHFHVFQSVVYFRVSIPPNKRESLREFYRGHVYTRIHKGRLHQQVCHGHKNLFYRKYSVEKNKQRLMNNVKRENVRESRILNSLNRILKSG